MLDFPFKIKIQQPINPMATPKIWVGLKVILKNKIPKMRVLRGVKELIIELTVLEMCCCAIANKNAGINEPTIAVKVIYFHLEAGITYKFLNPIINKNVAAKTIRSAPTCMGESPKSPFLIRINELPQIRAKTDK